MSMSSYYTPGTERPPETLVPACKELTMSLFTKNDDNGSLEKL